MWGILKHNVFKLFTCIVLIGFFATKGQAQSSIYEIMGRTDLSISEIEKLANDYFAIKGKGRGSGYKQYSRWLYERQFHTNDQGYLIDPNVEQASYQTFVNSEKFKKKANITWTELGPSAWTASYGWNPGMGRINAVAVNQTDTNIIYIGSNGGGVWKTTNGGISWTPLVDNTNNGYMSVSSVCIDPSNPNVVYFTASAVVKSVNGGSTWTGTAGGPASPKKVIVHPTNSNILFATGTNGIWRSTNAGTSWTQVNSTSMEDIEFNPANPNIMYASCASGSSNVWRSVNGGINWNALGSNSGLIAAGRTLIGVSKEKPNIVYIAQATTNGLFGKFYKSTDSGATFVTIVTGNPNNGTNYFGYEIDGKDGFGQAGYDMALCVNPANADEIVIGGIICWRSNDGGKTFKPATEWYYPNPTGYNHADVHALEFVKKTVYSGSDGGIFKNVNQSPVWIDLSAGLGIRQIYRISCAKTDASVITAGSQDNGTVFKRQNGNWVDWIGGDGMDNAISPINANVAIGTSQYGAIYHTDDGGINVTDLNQPAAGNFITPLVMHPNNHDTIYGGWTGIWRSTNGGLSWTNISAGAISGLITALAVAPSNPKYIYGSIGSVLYRTTNGGLSWTSVTASANITSIFVSQNNPQKIWITCNSSTARVFVSTNMGSNFTDLSNGLPALSARSIVIQNNSLEGVYVGMNIGVYYRDNNQTSWTMHGSGLPVVSVNEVEIHEASGKLRVATYGRGIWESDLQNKIPCSVPVNLTSSITGPTTVQVKWNSVPNSNGYTVEYQINGSVNWLGSYTTTDTSYIFTDLLNNINYNWRVRTNCTGNISNFAQAKFLMYITCARVSELAVHNITSKTATLSWKSNSDAITYTVQYREMPVGAWSEAITTDLTNLDLLNLTDLTDYQWRVKANCIYDSSNFTVDSFRTASICGLACCSPLNPTIIDLTFSTAKVAWNKVKMANSYYVEYRPSGTTVWYSAGSTTDSFLVINSLNPGPYDWRVYTDCGLSSSTYTLGSFTIYCHASGASNEFEYIRYVKLGSFERKSGPDEGYKLVTTPKISLLTGGIYYLTLAAGFTGVPRTLYWSVYFDNNNNGIFTDGGDLVGQKKTTDTSKFNITFRVPDSAKVNNSRLRVLMKWGSYPNSCNLFRNGEVEDYLIKIVSAPSSGNNPIPQPDSSLTIYPVPADKILNYTCDLKSDQSNFEVSISNIEGRTLYKENYFAERGILSRNLDVSLLKEGVYFFSIHSTEGQQVRRFIIMR
jgi:photosystem II stability/assembly factor-like uncharacterized protein